MFPPVSGSNYPFKRAEYQDQLARKRAEDELAMKAQMQEQELRKQEESVKKQEGIRRATIEHELQLKHKYELEKIDAQTLAQAKAARENRDVNLEQLRLHEEENRKTVIEKIKTGGEIVGAGLKDFLNDKTKITAAVGGLTALAIGWYTAKRGTSGFLSLKVKSCHNATAKLQKVLESNDGFVFPAFDIFFL